MSAWGWSISQYNRYFPMLDNSSSGRARRLLRLMEKQNEHRLVARQEMDNAFWTENCHDQIPLHTKFEAAQWTK